MSSPSRLLVSCRDETVIHEGVALVGKEGASKVKVLLGRPSIDTVMALEVNELGMRTTMPLPYDGLKEESKE